MGYKNRTEQDTTLSNDNSSSLSEALLFATMCIIGLPVDVYVKNGSVYSGIFYTASVEKDYGIILKNAKLTKKGKSDANISNGTAIETLVILSADLVQVVAKGVQIPADGIAGIYSGDNVEAVAGTVASTDGHISEAKRSIRTGMNKRHNQRRISVRNENGCFHGDGPSKAEKENQGKNLPLNNIQNAVPAENGKRDVMDLAKVEEAFTDLVNGRQVGDERSQGQQDSCTHTFDLHREENVDGVQESCPKLGSCEGQVIPPDGVHPNMTFKHPNGVAHDSTHEHNKPENQCRERPTSAGTPLDAARSDVSTSSAPTTDATSGLHSTSLAASTDVIPHHSSHSKKNTKEFKLNPGAKIFSPSFGNHVSATHPAIPTVTSMGYLPSNSQVLPIAATAQSEVGTSPYIPHSSLPAKFAPYCNLTTGNGGSTTQYSQPITGHVGSRTQPVRYAGQYPVQAGPTYVHPNSQAVMFGRVGGQLVYMQPVSNDLVQSVAAMSPISGRPALTPHQVQFSKHQGNAAGQALQLCVPSPLVAGGLQPFPISSHIPVLQPPIPANRPIPIPRSTGLYSTKFP